MATLDTLLDELLSLAPRSAVLEVELGFLRAGTDAALLHLDHGFDLPAHTGKSRLCGTLQRESFRSGGSVPIHAEWVGTIESVLDEEVCPSCFQHWFIPPTHPLTGLWETRRVMDAAQLTSLKQTVGDLRPPYHWAGAALVALRAVDLPAGGFDWKPLVDTARARASATRLEAYRLLSAPAVMDKVLNKAKVSFLGKDRVASGYLFDETPVLVGIQHYSVSDWSEIIRTLMEVHALSDDPLRLGYGLTQRGADVVAVLPRYLAEYVATVPKARVSGLHPSASIENSDTTEVLLEAASLWNPSGRGALASLTGALRAARASVEEDS